MFFIRVRICTAYRIPHRVAFAYFFERGWIAVLYDHVFLDPRPGMVCLSYIALSIPNLLAIDTFRDPLGLFRVHFAVNGGAENDA